MSQYFQENINQTEDKKIIKIKFQEKNYELYTSKAVFSKDKFDYGSKLLLETITKEDLSGKVLDLGCGYGVIGLLLADKYPQLSVDMVDITTRAIKLSKENSQKLKLSNTTIFQSDIYQEVKSKYNYIITNPPIRAGKDTIRKFLIDAEKHLISNGELWFVMRKDHGVKTMIKELETYYSIKIQAKSKGFYIVKCQVV